MEVVLESRGGDQGGGEGERAEHAAELGNKREKGHHHHGHAHTHRKKAREKKEHNEVRREKTTPSEEKLLAVSRSLSFPPTSPRKRRRARKAGSALRSGRKHHDALAKSPLAACSGSSGGSSFPALHRQGEASGGPSPPLPIHQRSNGRNSNSSSPRDACRPLTSRSGSLRRVEAGVGSGLGSGSGAEAREKREKRENSGRNLTEDFQAQHTLDEYSSAIFGDELTEEWTEVENFSDVDDDDLILQQEAEERLFQRQQNLTTPTRSLPDVARDRFANFPERLRRNGNWGGQGRELMITPPVLLMADTSPAPGDAQVVCNPLFMNNRAQTMLSSKKTAWNVPSREDTLVKRMNPLYQNVLLTALLGEVRQEWPPAIPKKKLFPLRKKQSIPDLRPFQKPEKKTENPLYRKVIPGRD
mmetsp:Transcript_11799/g.47626  ORF Transcript_11799/g.47626 Transcript_11799/m.47626 type:complete len:415 (-) Transcript_11799:432-1676(-)